MQMHRPREGSLWHVVRSVAWRAERGSVALSPPRDGTEACRTPVRKLRRRRRPPRHWHHDLLGRLAWSSSCYWAQASRASGAAPAETRTSPAPGGASKRSGEAPAIDGVASARPPRRVCPREHALRRAPGRSARPSGWAPGRCVRTERRARPERSLTATKARVWDVRRLQLGEPPADRPRHASGKPRFPGHLAGRVSHAPSGREAHCVRGAGQTG